ncbi:hypothetical protein [Nocardia gipuzkoensis]
MASTLQVRNPATGETVHTAAQVDAAVARSAIVDRLIAVPHGRIR